MEIFLLKGKDPGDAADSDKTWEKTWIVVAGLERDARKLLPGNFEVYEVEVRAADLGGMQGVIGQGVIGWMGAPRP